jgi:hypothetical protein
MAAKLKALEPLEEIGSQSDDQLLTARGNRSNAS